MELLTLNVLDRASFWVLLWLPSLQGALHGLELQDANNGAELSPRSRTDLGPSLGISRSLALSRWASCWICPKETM